MALLRDLPDQRQHRRVHAVGGEQRRAGVQQAGAGHHRIGLRFAGRQRRSQRHIGRALLMPGVDDPQGVAGALESIEQSGRYGRRAARRRCRCHARAGFRPSLPPCVIVFVSAAGADGFFRLFRLLVDFTMAIPAGVDEEHGAEHLVVRRIAEGLGQDAHRSCRFDKAAPASCPPAGGRRCRRAAAPMRRSHS